MKIRQVAIAFDQLFNTLLSGYADETLSARAYRMASETLPKRRWLIARRVIDTIFFWEKEHCFKAYVSEKQRNHFPSSYKGTKETSS